MMPRLEGRTSTRKTVALEKAAIGSFLMLSESTPHRRCAITGCEHWVDECEEGKHAGPATVWNLDKFNSSRDPYVGWICTCCVDKVTDQDEGVAR